MMGLMRVRNSCRLAVSASKLLRDSSSTLLSNHHIVPTTTTATTSRRPLSTDTTATTNPLDNNDPTTNLPEQEIVLYQRGPGRNALPRSGLGFSSFHTAYWIWYLNDFIPTVNASDMHNLHIDPMVGVVGIVFSAVIQAIFFAYPKRLVSRLTYKPESQELLFYTHTIPFVTVATGTSSTSYSIGAAPILDPASADAKHLTGELGGDFSAYRGHLAVAKPGQWPPYLVDLREATDVPEPELLFEALLAPHQLAGGSLTPKKKKKANARGAATTTGGGRESRLRKIVRRRR